jgi:hypothetical protein
VRVFQRVLSEVADRIGSPTVPSDHVADQRHIDELVVAEGRFVWTRYNVMVSISSALIGFVLLILKDAPSLPGELLALGGCLFGFRLARHWHVLTDTGWTLQSYFALKSELYKSRPESRPATSQRKAALAVIELYQAAYVVLFVAAFVGLARAAGWL